MRLDILAVATATGAAGRFAAATRGGGELKDGRLLPSVAGPSPNPPVTNLALFRNGSQRPVVGHSGSVRLERLEQNISWEDELQTSLMEETRYERLYRLRRRATLSALCDKGGTRFPR